MPAPKRVVENWPGSAMLSAVRGKGNLNGKQATRPVTTSLLSASLGAT